MGHVSLHNTIDIPPHLPIHTRLLEYMQQYSRSGAVALKREMTINISYSIVEWRSTLSCRTVSPSAEITLHPAMYFTTSAGCLQYCLWYYDTWWVGYMIAHETFNDDSHHHVQWQTPCAMGKCDGPTSWAEGGVLYHHRTKWRAARARCKCDCHKEGHLQRQDELRWFGQINDHTSHGTEDPSGQCSRQLYTDVLGKAHLSLHVRIEAQHLPG